MVLDHFDIDRSCLDKLSLSIRSSIPTGKGMASSTADIGASIMAILDYLDQDMDSDLISKIVARVNPLIPYIMRISVYLIHLRARL